MFFMLFLGAFSTNLQLCFFSVVNNFGQSVIPYFSVGTGLSGLIVIVIRATTVIIFGDDPNNKIPITLYIATTVIMSIADWIINTLYVFPTQTFMNKF